ncbi:Uncharacterized protein APZ42_015705 [Daphnia magna]|uniref:Reverse transcriptase domain-containing protein n=1 Tax=Daphnia magna TaxID=35525 RepID=A0A162NQL4_9CRUS|nr:Uncharacterized protein APZ42_015705 [Daphnia magna]
MQVFASCVRMGSFDGHFDLLCPKLDETMVRYWKQAVGKDWRSNMNDFQEKSWQSVQYQVLDSFRPLLQTWNQLPVGSPLLNNMEDSLKLLGAAFAGISKLRRANAMRHVATDLLPLLKDDRMFSSREFERLFGEKFLTAMVKDADDFEKVKKFAGRSGGPFTTRSENRGSSGRGGHGYRVPDSRYPPTSSGTRRGGQGFTPSYSKSQQQSSRYVPLSSNFTLSFPVGCRLTRFGVAWSQFSTDPWILSTVLNGYFIDFIDLPFQQSAPAGCVQFPWFPWPIINLKRLNAFIRYQHFKMEGLDCVRYLLQRGDWMVKLDLQDAYFLVSLFPDHRKYFRFLWKNSIYEYSCLPFGLCTALFPNSTMFRQGPAGQSGFSPRLPALDITGLVPSPSSNVHRRSTHIPSDSVSCPLAQVGTAPTPPVQQVSTVRLEEMEEELPTKNTVIFVTSIEDIYWEKILHLDGAKSIGTASAVPDHQKSIAEAYINRILGTFCLSDYKSRAVPTDPFTQLRKQECPQDSTEFFCPYREAIGSLMFSAICPVVIVISATLCHVNMSVCLLYYLLPRRI